ncbi:MAG TPA: TonB-dependent receptor, partial [Dehalococcoidia bacterium]|nr:TonB-dependent receptor [Dehalococcoidia bacterium]
MKFTLRSASSAAIIAGLAGALPVWAQETAAPAPQVDQTSPQAAQPETTTERVVVTGSFIQGTPEDAALPVEVYSSEELEEQGAPTALEFAKSLTIAGPVTGEAYYFSGAALTGSVNYNLRGLGFDKTLTLLNGRRTSANTSNIPAAAMARTEVLKDGAAVIYGADATGGVVNFITRDDFTGLEARANYKYVNGSDGDYGLSLLGGIGEGDVNFLWSLEWEHRSRLEAEDRGFAMKSLNFAVNPAPWSTLTNLAGWTARGALPASPSIANEFGAALSTPLADFTPQTCAAVGGFYVNTFTCSYNYIPYYNLVEENDIYRGYAQLNAAVTDNMDFHFEASYGQVVSPQVFGSPAQPVIRGPAMATGAVNQFYVPITNPHAAAFAARVAAPVGTQGFTPTTYRAFAHGGNPVFGMGNGYGVPSKIDNQVWRVSAAINGTLGEWAGAFSDIGYDVALTYNQSISYGDAADVIGFRLQQALNGFGGPNCNVPDLDPNRFGTQNAALAGKGNCSWWTPFATGWSSQPELGLANPQYVAGTENSIELARWLFDDRASESINSSLTLDAVINGRSGINLPGGEIGWAAGAQVRQLEFREVVNSTLYNGNVPCDWYAGTTSQNGVGSPAVESNPLPTNDPNFRGCTPDNPGPFVFFGINPPDYNDQQQYSFFGELQLPVLDNLNFQAAVRREEFSGGLGATVYKVSGKWDVFGPFSIRGSYGTNYQAPPVGVIPGEITNAVRSYTIA